MESDEARSATSKRRRPNSATLRAEHDRLIGWPEPLQVEGETGPVYELRVSGYTASSQSEIMCALLTLAKHGVQPEDLCVSHAVVGNELPTGTGAKEAYEAERDEVGERGNHPLIPFELFH